MKYLAFILILLIVPAAVFSAASTAPGSPVQKSEPALFTFEINAFDLNWYNGMGYVSPDNTPPFADPHDLQAQILLDGEPFSPPIYTPYRFGEAGNLPFVPGVYSVDRNGYNEWEPISVALDYIVSNYEMDFLGLSNHPVELSSFSAVLNPQHQVLVTWVSQSESNLMGYKLLRSENPYFSNAETISPLILATNTSSTQTYNWVDNQIVNGSSYYYWLEALGASGNSTYFGSINIDVSWTGIGDDEPPALSETSLLGLAWPNPFRVNGSTTFSLSLKAGETGTVGIYNLLGQCVRSFPVQPNTKQISWDGRDRNGKPCSSGIYLYKLDTPSVSQTRKLLLRK